MSKLLSYTLRLIPCRLKLWLYLSLSRPKFRHALGDYEPNLFSFRFGIPLVLKRTCRTISTEADALRYLNSVVPHLPIPKLIDSFHLDGLTWTLLSKLPGRDLDEIEESTPEQMDAIAEDVLAIVHELWRLPQPPELKGRVMVSASGHGLRHPVSLHERLGGPYESTHECYRSMVYDFEDRPPKLVESIIQDTISWVHADLAKRNVLVRDGRVSGIVDWEDAGWLPRHWLLHVLRRPRPGCSGIWVRHWINDYRFEPEVEEAYSASQTMILYPLA